MTRFSGVVDLRVSIFTLFLLLDWDAVATKLDSTTLDASHVFFAVMAEFNFGGHTVTLLSMSKSISELTETTTTAEPASNTCALWLTRNHLGVLI
jgi:hypothetical protein